MQLWPPCRKILVKTRESHLLESRKKWKNYAFSKQIYFSSRCSSEHAQWIFGKPAVTLLPRIRKTFHKSKNVEVTIFWSEFFFHRKLFSNNGQCNFDNPTKNFLRKTTDLPLTFQKMTKKFMNFSKENCFSSNCASVRVECSCDHPVKTFSSKLWKLFAGFPQRTKKW